MVVLPTVLCWLFAAPALHSQTAGELVQSAITDYNKGNYEAAAQRFERFLTDFGRSEEARPALEQVRRLLGWSYVRTGKFVQALPVLENYLEAHSDGESIEPFRFWLGVARLQAGDTARAATDFDAYLEKHPQTESAPQARLLRAMARFQLQEFDRLAKDMEADLGSLPPDMASQGRILLLAAYTQSDQDEKALALGSSIDPFDPSLSSLGSYHLLMLELGGRLLDGGQHAKALTALQRVWSRERILARQRGRLTELEATAPPATDNSATALRARELVRQIRAELGRIESMADYDAALQLRIARCFSQLERQREAYLVLDRAIRTLPDGDLLMHAFYHKMLALADMERWPGAVAAADEFAKRFPRSELLPNIRYLQAEAHMRLDQYAEAEKHFTTLARERGFAEAERCSFLAGYCRMMQELNAEAVVWFDQHLQNFSDGPFTEQTVYWRAMAHHYNKDYPAAREAHAAYLQKYPQGTHRVDSALRRAQGLFNMEQFQDAYKELEAFLTAHGNSPQADEARNLLGDCYFALGEIERGLRAFQQVSPADGRLYDYAWFRIGLAHKSLEQFDAMQKHFDQFLQTRADSPRVPEALGQLAWLHRRNEQPDKAKDVYWTAIRDHGNDPDAAAVEELLQSVARLYRSPEERTQLRVRLQDLETEAVRLALPTLAARARWMQGQIIRREDPAAAARHFARLPELVDELRFLSPPLLADAGDALRAADDRATAREAYRTLLRWYPRSLGKDRAYAGLGLLAVTTGENSEAYDWFEKFERDTIQSPLLADVIQARANMLEADGKYEEAITELSRVLEVESARGLPWVEALYRMGSIRMKQNDPARAVPYFQRIYVMYGRWNEYVAKSYLQSARAFELLNRPEEAVNTYREFVQNTHLSALPEYKQAQQRLQEMGG